MAYKEIKHNIIVIEDTTGRYAGFLQPDGTVDALAFLMSDSGAPTDGVQASLASDMTNANADVTSTAVDYGSAGNQISVTYVDPSANSQPLVVYANGNDITVSLATNGAGTITSTANDVVAAFAANAKVAALITGTAEGTGLGVVNAKAKAYLTSGADVTAGPAGSALYLDTDTDTLYRKSDAQTWAAFAGTGDIVTQTITNGVTDKAPSEDAVFDALALKAPLASPAFTGTVDLTGCVTSMDEKTPVNAVASTGVLDLSGNAQNNETVTLGTQTYTWQIAINAAGVAASGVLTYTGNATEGETVVIGPNTYKYRAAIGAGAKAEKDLDFSGLPLDTETFSIDGKQMTFVTTLTEVAATSTLTAAADATDGNSVTIGSTTYTFKETLGAAYDVLIDGVASNTLDNLIAAINGAAGEGTTYGNGTVAHPDVTAVAGVGDTVDITAKVVGTAGNSIATTELSGVFSWTAGTMAGGVDAVVNEIVIGTVEGSIDNAVAALTGAAGEGTTYSTGTVAHTTCDITKKDADTLTATYKTIGFAGNSVVLAETLTNAAWAGGAVALSGGVDAEAANDVLIGVNAEASIDNLVLAVNAGAGEGTNYGTGTVVHPTVTGSKSAADEFTGTAKSVGEAGNSIATTDTVGNASWANATLTGGEEIEQADDVLIGATASDSIDNLIAAINGAAGEGTTYGTGTVANTSATAAAGAGDTMDVTAIVKGTVGDSIATTETMANGSWTSGATLGSGVDGTVGVANETCFDGSYLYHCIAANTTADTNWRRVSLGAAY